MSEIEEFQSQLSKYYKFIGISAMFDTLLYCTIAHSVVEIRNLAMNVLENLIDKDIVINEPDRVLISLIDVFEMKPLTRELDIIRIIGKLLLVS